MTKMIDDYSKPCTISNIPTTHFGKVLITPHKHVKNVVRYDRPSLNTLGFGFNVLRVNQEGNHPLKKFFLSILFIDFTLPSDLRNFSRKLVEFVRYLLWATQFVFALDSNLG